MTHINTNFLCCNNQFLSLPTLRLVKNYTNYHADENIYFDAIALASAGGRLVE